MATRFSILARESPLTEEPGGLKSMWSQELNRVTKPPPPPPPHTHTHTHTHTHMLIVFKIKSKLKSVEVISYCQGRKWDGERQGWKLDLTKVSCLMVLTWYCAHPHTV